MLQEQINPEISIDFRSHKCERALAVSRSAVLCSDRDIQAPVTFMILLVQPGTSRLSQQGKGGQGIT